MSEKKNRKKYEMVLYTCPYCGSKNLEDLSMIKLGNTWACEICKTEMTAS